MKVGIAGLGRMGAAIALRLLDVGHEVIVWNRSPQKMELLVKAGARASRSARELGDAAEVVITILTDAAAIDGTYRVPEGLLAAAIDGKLFVEMSTVRPEVEEKLAAELRAKGAALVDCPVGGTVGPARDGKLFGFAGGSDRDFERAKPLLAQLCRRVEHVGATGAGSRMKLAINLPLLVYWQALGEALVLMRPLGLPPERLLSILADTSGAPNVLKARGQALVEALSGKEIVPVTFDVDSVRKDMRTFLEEATVLGCSLPVTAAALECFDQAAREGLGRTDSAALPVHFAQHGAG